MIVEKISLKSKRNSNIFIVQIDEVEYVLHSDIIVKHGLSTGCELDETKLREIVFESDVLVATNLAIKYMSSKIISTKQLKDYLRGKGYKANVIGKVIEKFNEYEILNDENFANTFISLKQNSLSKRALENKLLQKGVDKDMAKNCLTDFDDYDVCIKTAEKFMRSKTYTDENVIKLMRHLSYKGFEYETINKCLNYLKNK